MRLTEGSKELVPETRERDDQLFTYTWPYLDPPEKTNTVISSVVKK